MTTPEELTRIARNLAQKLHEVAEVAMRGRRKLVSWASLGAEEHNAQARAVASVVLPRLDLPSMPGYQAPCGTCKAPSTVTVVVHELNGLVRSRRTACEEHVAADGRDRPVSPPPQTDLSTPSQIVPVAPFSLVEKGA